MVELLRDLVWSLPPRLGAMAQLALVFWGLAAVTGVACLVRRFGYRGRG